MKVVRHFAVSLFGLSILVLPNLARAEDSKPFVVATVSKVDDLQKDVTHFLNLAGSPELQEAIDQFVNQLAIDKTKPLVAALSFGEQGPAPVIWFPTKNGQQTLQALKNNRVSIKQDGQFTVIDVGFKNVFVQEKNGYLVCALSPAHLKNTGSPPAIANRLANDYRVAVSVNFQNIPDVLKRQAIFWIESQLQKELKQKRFESNAEYLGRQVGSKLSASVFKTILNEGQELTFGVKLTPVSHRFVTELKLTAANGTNLEKQLATFQSVSRFSRLLSKKSPFNLAFDFKLPQQLRTLLVRQIDNKLEEKRKQFVSIEDDARKSAFSFQHETMRVLKDHVREGRMHFVASALPNSDGTTSLFGVVHLHGAQKIERLALKFVKENRRNRLPRGLKLNVDSHRGFNIHEFETPVADRQAAKFFGRNARVFVAVGSHEVFFTFGSNGVETIKNILDEVYDSNAKPVSSAPFQFQVRGGFWSNQVPANDEIGRTIKGSLNNKDLISFTVTSIPRGVKAQFIVEEDYLRFTAKLFALGMQQAGRQSKVDFERVSDRINK